MSQRVFPQLRMTNWKRTRAFYVDGPGFIVDWEHRFEPGLPVFAQLTRAGLQYRVQLARQSGCATYRWHKCSAQRSSSRLPPFVGRVRLPP